MGGTATGIAEVSLEERLAELRGVTRRKTRIQIACLTVVIFGGFMLFGLWLLPWQTPPVKTLDIWLPAGYEQVSREAQGQLAKKWLEGSLRLEVAPEVFEQMNLQTTYVFGLVENGRAKVTYLGEGERPSVIFFATRSIAVDIGYNPTLAILSGKSLTIQTERGWFLLVVMYLFAAVVFLIVGWGWGYGISRRNWENFHDQESRLTHE